MLIDRRSIQNFDWIFLGFMTILIAFGVVNLMSATYTGGEELLSPSVRRQLTSLGVGLAALVVALLVPYRHFDRFAIPLYAISLLAVASTLVLSQVNRGAQAWLFDGRVQPSELAKIGMVLILARYFARNSPNEITRLRELVPPLLLVALPVGLIVLQNDIGVAVLTLLVGLTYLPLVRIPFRAWLMVAALGAASLAALWSYGLKDYQRERIMVFLDPSLDPLSAGYHAMQSRIAVGAGGLLGQGWLEGTQTQLRFLPTQHTDFVFSVLAEEWGFLGSLLTLSIFLGMLLWGLWIGRSSKDAFGAMLAVGLVGALFWPAAINVAMVLGLAPVIGVPLPLFSYGGSSLITALISLGLLLNVSMRRYVF